MGQSLSGLRYSSMASSLSLNVTQCKSVPTFRDNLLDHLQRSSKLTGTPVLLDSMTLQGGVDRLHQNVGNSQSTSQKGDGLIYTAEEARSHADSSVFCRPRVFTTAHCWTMSCVTVSSSHTLTLFIERPLWYFSPSFASTKCCLQGFQPKYIYHPSTIWWKVKSYKFVTSASFLPVNASTEVTSSTPPPRCMSQTLRLDNPVMLLGQWLRKEVIDTSKYA
jgi:hypothetical protein